MNFKLIQSQGISEVETSSLSFGIDEVPFGKACRELNIHTQETCYLICRFNAGAYLDPRLMAEMMAKSSPGEILEAIKRLDGFEALVEPWQLEFNIKNISKVWKEFLNQERITVHHGT